VRQHHIGENPGWGLDVQLELQVTPVLAPVVPQIVPRRAGMELAQVDQVAQGYGLRAHRAGW